jgi:hypothetical protein
MQQELVLTGFALLASAALLVSLLRGKVKKIDPKLAHQQPQRVAPELQHQKAQREFLQRLLEGAEQKRPPRKPRTVDKRIEHEFNRLFMTTTKAGKEALIERWVARQKCGRLEAMRLAIDEWRRENR